MRITREDMVVLDRVRTQILIRVSESGTAYMTQLLTDLEAFIERARKWEKV